jgi:hypothetical protein
MGGFNLSASSLGGQLTTFATNLGNQMPAINVDEVGSTLKSAASTAADAAGKIGTDALNKGGELLDNIENFYRNISSPDGVQSTFEKKIATNKKTLNSLSSYAHLDINSTVGIAPNILNENTANGDAVLYNQLVTSMEWEVPGPDGKTNQKVPPSTRPYSVFNKFSLVNYQGSPLFPENADKSETYQRLSQASIRNPTATQIIEVTSSYPENVGYRYDYSDFALAKYFGKIPNSQMITLRRFAFPAPDDIISPKGPDQKGTMVSTGQPDIARAVTWLGEDAGNTMAEIIKFSNGFSWKDAEAKVQTVASNNRARSGGLGEMIESSAFLRSFNAAARGMDSVDLANTRAHGGFDPFSETYPNHQFGPLNVINKVLMRDQGLVYEQEFTLKFEYELRSIGGANPKVLMLDQLANILALTYNNAPFWGGSVRYTGDGSVARPLGNIEKLRNGDYLGFMKTVVSDIGLGQGSLMDNLKGIVGTAGKALQNMLGGGLMEMFNSPQGGNYVNALLTGDPTGQWHVTIGNPLNPIMVVGNLALQTCNISFEGNIGPEDFPEKMIVSVTLKPGRPRDKAEIESMFNAGRGRFYLTPGDGVDINKTLDVSAYGNKDLRKFDHFTNTFKKVSTG